MITDYHAAYYAHELSRVGGSGVDRLGRALFDACVDLNPHQIEAAMFALRSPISKGALLADEVGLGKTIEAGLVLCQYWAERRRNMLVICPASLRKQWELELSEKFNLHPIVLDAKIFKDQQKNGNPNPFRDTRIIICSMHYAASKAELIKSIAWDLVVIDEAHKLRNVYRQSNRLGQQIQWATKDRKKILLTATPLQNSLLELYGLSTLIDERLFGDLASFRTQYISYGGDISGLRDRLSVFCLRTLRRQVTEFVRYTERRLITRPFKPTDQEHKLYEAISSYLRRDETYALPSGQKHLLILLVRKVMASSPHAVAGTLEIMRDRLLKLRDDVKQEASALERLISVEDIDDDLLDELLEDEEDNLIEVDAETTEQPGEVSRQIDLGRLESEIEELTEYIRWSRNIGIDTKTRALLKTLEIGFSKMEEMGAARKVVIFTESRRTQNWLKEFLEGNGYAGQVLTFNGTNKDDASGQIYQEWLAENKDSGRATGSRQINLRTAIIDRFKNQASILIATEAGAEGLNLQFCSAVINFDLPWNPQRIEQRIGRCHRYGQKHDVVVINFLNERNEADCRVHELLEHKFNLFTGVFGASDDVLGSIETGVGFERIILEIYQKCRSEEEIQSAFEKLQAELDEQIQTKMRDTRKLLLENFDEEVHDRLRGNLAGTKERLDRIGRLFWSVTKHTLKVDADFDDETFSFRLNKSPLPDIVAGRYHLISKSQENIPGEYLYRLSHPLGEYVLEDAKGKACPPAEVVFNMTGHFTRIAVVERLKRKSGWLSLQHLHINSFDSEEYLLFSAVDDDGNNLDQETCEKMFMVDGVARPFRSGLLASIGGVARPSRSGSLTSIGLDEQSLAISKGENLPHWTCDNAIYHVSFRLEDSVPASKRDEWLAERKIFEETAKREDRNLTEEEEKRIQYLFSERIEKFLDTGYGECHLSKHGIAELLAKAIKYFDGKRYLLHAWCVMPNHVHVIVEPFADKRSERDALGTSGPDRDGLATSDALGTPDALAAIIHSWKSYTAHEANKILKRTGEFWQKDAYNHIIRSEKEYFFQMKYVWENPEKAGLADWAWRWKRPDRDALGTLGPDRDGLATTALATLLQRLKQDQERHAKATLARNLEENNRHFFEARDQLDKWAEDMEVAAQKELDDTKRQIRDLQRRSRQAPTMEEQHGLLEGIAGLERKKRKLREKIFDIEDEIAAKRDRLVDALEKRMRQKTTVTPLFTIRWKVV